MLTDEAWVGTVWAFGGRAVDGPGRAADPKDGAIAVVKRPMATAIAARQRREATSLPSIMLAQPVSDGSRVNSARSHFSGTHHRRRMEEPLPRTTLQHLPVGAALSRHKSRVSDAPR